MGAAAFNEERFDEAAILFQEAFNLDPHPNLLFNIGRAHEGMGDFPAALHFYRQVQEMSPAGRVRDVVTTRIQEVEAVLVEQGYDPATVTSQTYVPRGTLRIETEPPGARVFVNNDFTGLTPLELPRVDEGSVQIRLTMEGFHPINDVARVRGRQVTLVRHRMESRTSLDSYVPPEPGTVTIRGPERGMAVYIDDARFGFTPIEEAVLAPGSYALRIEHLGYRPYVSTLTVRSGETQELVAEMRREGIGPEDGPTAIRRAGTVMMIVGGGVTAIGAGIGMYAWSQSQAYNNDPASPDRAATRDRALGAALGADIALGIGVGVAATGALLRFVFGKERRERDPDFDGLVLQPLGSPSGGAGGATLQWRRSW